MGGLWCATTSKVEREKKARSLGSINYILNPGKITLIDFSLTKRHERGLPYIWNFII